MALVFWHCPGGASAGKFDFPQAALTPDFATEENSKRAEENGD